MKALGRPAAVMPTSRGDVEDLHWLDAKVATLGDGIEAAKEIWLNWSDLRCVGRLHPGMTAGDFLASVLGGLRLDVGELVKALPEMSTREIAKVAGVSNYTVAIEKQAVRNLTPDAEPARVVGADGKSYPGRVIRTVEAELIEPDHDVIVPAPESENQITSEPTAPSLFDSIINIIKLIEDLPDPEAIAAAVPTKRRTSTARKLRKVDTALGTIAWKLEALTQPTPEEEQAKREAEEAARPEKARLELEAAKAALDLLLHDDGAARNVPILRAARGRVDQAEDQVLHLARMAEDKARFEARRAAGDQS
jgi:hypothetical protein